MNDGGDASGSIVFTDIVGFTEYTNIHGDDHAVDLLAQQGAIVRAALPRRARIVNEMGDGLLLWFDDAREALETALDLQDRFEHACAHGSALWVRIGMHWGTPKRRGDDIVGNDVNLASRVASLAGPGEVLCTQATSARATSIGAMPHVAFDPIGPVYVKGISDAVRVLRVHRAGAGASDGG